MAVKKLRMMNIVCGNKDLDNILKDLILDEQCEFTDAKTEIDESDFYIAMTEENADEILDMEGVGRLKLNKEAEEYMEKIVRAVDGLGYSPQIDKKYMTDSHDFSEIKNAVDDIHYKLINITEETEKIQNKLNKLNGYIYLEELRNMDIDFKKLMNMEHFTAKFGFLTKERRKKLSKNYENIFAVVLHVGTHEEKELYIIVSPKELDLEMERILRSTDFKEIIIEENYLMVPGKALKIIQEETAECEEDLMIVKKHAEKYLEEYKAKIDGLYTKLTMELKINNVKKKIVSAGKFSYFSSWFPEGKEEIYNNIFLEYENVLVSYKNDSEVSPLIEKPTLLKNSKFFAPFEQMVNMYGVPGYNEIDTTMFFGIAYIIIFGAMFGDLGQGIVFLLAGLFMAKKGKKTFGELLVRVASGTIFFGIIYDSFFGYEHIISKYIHLPIFFRPMENINKMLIAAIIIGIILLSISYYYSIYNKIKSGELGEGLFGKNGVNGMMLFFLILYSIYSAATGNSLISGNLLLILIVLSIVILVFEQPLGNIVKGEKELFEETKTEYFTESGFNILETFLSIVSNSISFIRIGAFALNHVGLFIAFHIMANMTGSVAGNIVMFLLGNIIIIGLEGLIVFIQGLRLFYYELFSKFYKGDGVLFNPDKI